MKKFFMLILLIALTTQAGYAQMFETPTDYVVSKDMPFECEVSMDYIMINTNADNNTFFYWSGKEWIINNLKTTDFITCEEFPSIPDPDPIYKYSQHKYLWDGENYIAYPNVSGYQWPLKQSTIYKLTPDCETKLESYIVPGSLKWMSYADGVYYAKCSVDSWAISGYKIFYSTDLENWQEFASWQENEPLMEMPLSFGNNTLIRRYQYLDHFSRDVDATIELLEDGIETEITYERILPKVVDVDGTYFWTSSQNGDVTTVEFSKDGVYWAGFEMPENIGDIQRIYPVGDRLIVQSGAYYHASTPPTYVSFDKQEVYSMVEEALADEQAYVKLNNTILGFDQPPVIENDRMLVPMRFLFEQMGEEVGWENETQTATVMGKNDVVSFSIDNTAATVNGAEKTMDVPARLINDKTMIPLRFLSEELGYTVEWDDETKTAKITQ